MQTLTQPSLLLKPFAEQGDKNTIPNVNTDPTEPQKADFTSGFPAITSLPTDQGGLPPERQDFNALGYLTTLYDFFYQAGGTFTFDPTTSTAIGGYPLGARLWYTNADGVSMILRSTIQNNTNNFLNDSSVIGTVGENKPWLIENFMGVKSETPLFAFNWYDHAPDEASWLCADSWGWNDGEVYISAYDMLEDQYTNGTQKSFNLSAYNIYGSPTVLNGVISDFSSSNYVETNIAFSPSNNTWSLISKFKTNASMSTGQIIFHPIDGTSGNLNMGLWINTSGKLELDMSSDGSNWNIASNTGSTTLNADTDYFTRVSFTGSAYTVEISTDGDNWTTDLTISSSTPVLSGKKLRFGSFTDGRAINQIDMNGCRLVINSNTVWVGNISVQYTEGQNGMNIAPASNMGAVQDLYEQVGVAWYYIIDTANTRFKLPRTKFGFVGLRDSVGKYVPESLPNVTGRLPFGDGETLSSRATGAFKGFANYSDAGWNVGGSGPTKNMNFDASRCSNAYQDGASVQQNATQMHLYFFVGNSIRNQTEVDVGQITEALSQKWDSSNMVVTTALPANPQTGVFYFIK